MIFSKSCEYALRSVLYICTKSSEGINLSVKEIAAEIESPEPFTAKILQQLARQKIISSIKGPNGGFYIDKQKKPVTILQIVEAIEGHDFFDRCVLGLKNCTERKPCPLHEHFIQHRKDIKELFKTKTVHDLIIKQKGKINLK
jgi:Rrf2 family protein